MGYFNSQSLTDNYLQSSLQARDGEQQQEELLQGKGGRGRGAGEVEGGRATGGETGEDDELQQHRQSGEISLVQIHRDTVL